MEDLKIFVVHTEHLGPIEKRVVMDRIIPDVAIDKGIRAESILFYKNTHYKLRPILGTPADTPHVIFSAVAKIDTENVIELTDSDFI